MRERHAAGLAELAEMGLSIARDLRARALAAPDKETAAEMALAFHRVSRSVRQTYALEARFEREHRQVDREDAIQASRERLTRVQRKRRQVRNVVTGLIWTEYEDEEAEALDEALEALLIDMAEDEQAFLDAPLEACIARIRDDLGLPQSDDGEPRPAGVMIIHRSSG